jgi:hypothetical protein
LSAVILVEGESDRAALTALAELRGRNLCDERVLVVAMGGITNLGHHLARHMGDETAVVGLCDAGETGLVANALQRAGIPGIRTREDLESNGFYVCVEDLEDELIRALGTDAVIRFIEGQGELATFHRMQRQPAWRGRPVAAQLRRFCGIRSGRKVRYGRGLVEALDPDRVPYPLDAVLASV